MACAPHGGVTSFQQPNPATPDNDRSWSAYCADISSCTGIDGEVTCAGPIAFPEPSHAGEPCVSGLIQGVYNNAGKCVDHNTFCLSQGYEGGWDGKQCVAIQPPNLIPFTACSRTPRPSQEQGADRAARASSTRI